MTRFLLVSGDFTQSGGMDRANYSLARYLANNGCDVHLVAHTVDPSLATQPNVTWHKAARPARSTVLGEPLLRRAGERVWRELGGLSSGTRAIVNGGNCPLPDINWLHYVHAAVEPIPGSGILRRSKTRFAHARFVKSEAASLRTARLVIANSERTKRELIHACGIEPAKIRTVYCGVDPEQFYAATAEERQTTRDRHGLDSTKYLIVFVGALSDRRKGFDTLLESWRTLGPEISSEAQLLVIGSGSELQEWKERAEMLVAAGSIRFLGFRRDVPEILRASDALVSPTRYEPFGLAVLEALCCGVPAIVTRDAGVAELYPASIEALLLEKADDQRELADKLRSLIGQKNEWRVKLQPIASKLRAYTWNDMAREIFEITLATAPTHA
jgi:glycosyltransferase involved in cell wall biosynthesis